VKTKILIVLLLFLLSACKPATPAITPTVTPLPPTSPPAPIPPISPDYGEDEIVLSVGTGHGIFFKPLDEWITSTIQWAEKQ
jgi:hypothetical protein